MKSFVFSFYQTGCLPYIEMRMNLLRFEARVIRISGAHHCVSVNNFCCYTSKASFLWINTDTCTFPYHIVCSRFWTATPIRLPIVIKSGKTIACRANIGKLIVYFWNSHEKLMGRYDFIVDVYSGRFIQIYWTVCVAWKLNNVSLGYYFLQKRVLMILLLRVIHTMNLELIWRHNSISKNKRWINWPWMIDFVDINVVDFFPSTSLHRWCMLFERRPYTVVYYANRCIAKL